MFTRRVYRLISRDDSWTPFAPLAVQAATPFRAMYLPTRLPGVLIPSPAPHPYSKPAGYTILGVLMVPPNISAPCVSRVNFCAQDSCGIMISTASVMDMKRSLGVLSSVLLVTLGLLTVPVGFVALAFGPIEGIVLTVIGGLLLGLGIILNRRIDRPPTRHHH
jgi:hypothetical protein